MKMITLFDDLPDLSLIEIYSYLSCFDVIYSFSNLNRRLTGLLIERGFYRHVNLSSARYDQFKCILSLFQLNQIESVVIDCYASPLQLISWPYLPDLRKLRVKGVQDWMDVFNFAEQHANTLTDLSVQSSEYSSRTGATYRVCYPSWNFYAFIKNTLNHLFALRLLDFGIERTVFLHDWPLISTAPHLTYLRITLLSPDVLFGLMNTQPLCRTLKELHVTMSGVTASLRPRFHASNVWLRMEVLHTFTFIKSFQWHFDEEWFLLEILTNADVMPLLRRMNFCIVIDINDLPRMYHSSVFIDYRNVDVQYAFMINDNREHTQLLDYLRRCNRSPRRQIVSATYISDDYPNIHLLETFHQYYREKSTIRLHLFYTLPWIFNELVQLYTPERFIRNLEIFKSSSSPNTKICSRLIKLHMSDNVPSLAAFLPYIICPIQIVELHLLGCYENISLDLPFISRLILTDSLGALHNFTHLTNIQSVQIILEYRGLAFGNDDWTVLRKLSTLPRLKSLRFLLYDMPVTPNDINCQIVAEVAPLVIDFGFCFRRYHDLMVYDINSAYIKHSLFIEQLKNRILALPLKKQPYILTDEDGNGVNIWF